MNRYENKKEGMCTRHMRRLRWPSGLLLACMLLGIFCLPTAAAPKNGDVIPVRWSSTTGDSALREASYLIDGITYVPFRAFCDAFGNTTVSWNQSTRTATAKVGSLTVNASQGALYIEANGRYLYGVGKVINLEGVLYVPIRPMAKAFGLELSWNNASRSVSLTRTGKTLESGSTFYDADAVYWLSRIISAEAAGEPMLGKIAVGNVILNRVRSNLYPNTIYGVIFDRKHGTQFSPVSFGTIYRAPTADSIIAAKMCLDGANLSSDILFFMNPRIATSNWISQNRPFAFTIGNHDFYT